MYIIITRRITSVEALKKRKRWRVCWDEAYGVESRRDHHWLRERTSSTTSKIASMTACGF